MKIKKTILLSLFTISILFSQEYQQRTNYNQYLEPVDKILHGAGQDPGQIGGVGKDGFANYWEVMEENEKPIVYMYYESLFNIGTNWASKLKSALSPFKDKMIVIQFGLQLVGATEVIPNGDLDKDIEDFLDGVEELGLPVYARLGYEFNGLSWNGYQPQPYKESFIYLTNKIRERDLEIATVWNYVPDPTQPSNFMNYYPGDEYVDWWSINYFDVSQLSNSLSEAYLDSSEAHGKPVLIGESTPKGVGVLNGQTSWDTWFSPFFNLLKNEPGIKVTGYINWNWAEFPQWSTWGDTRLEKNEIVVNNFKTEMDDSVYFHAVSEKEFRESLGANESIPPPLVNSVEVNNSSFPAVVRWNQVEDESGISRYLIYNNGELYNYTKKTESVFINATPGENMSITVSAVDRAGNEGQVSSVINFVAPQISDNDNLLGNGDFELGKDSWKFPIFDANAQGRFDIDEAGLINGNNSAKITTQQTTNINFHMQLRQPLKVISGKNYVLSYSARANTQTTIETWLQQAESPFAAYLETEIELTTETQTFTDTAFVSQDDSVFVTFMVGNSGLAEIWIDNVILIEYEEIVEMDEVIINGEFDSGYDSWSLTPFVPQASGTLQIDDTGQLSGNNSAHITITANTGTNWHLQLEQPLSVKGGHTYAISYQAKAASATIMETWLQKSASPFTGYSQSNISLTTEAQFFTDTAFIPNDDNVFMRFMFGTSGLAEIWIDAVSIVDLGETVTAIDDNYFMNSVPTEYKLFAPYPNPFNPSTTIEYYLSEPAYTKIIVYNIVGQKVTELVDSFQSSGKYSINWNASNLSSGIYFIQLISNNYIEIKKALLLK